MLSNHTSALPAAPTASTPLPAETAPGRRRGAILAIGAIVGATLGVVAMTGVSAAAAPLAAGPSALVSAPGQLVGSALAAATTDRGPAPLDEIVADAASARLAARTAMAAARTVEADASASGLDLGDGPTAIDTTALAEASDRLEGHELVPPLLLPPLIADAVSETERVTAATADLRERLAAAEQRKAEEEAAAAAAAAAKRQAEEAARALAAANTVEGAQAFARELAASQYGWGGDQFSCLASLWNKESDWNYQAYNPSSGATGIPQALPGSKMAAAGADWQTSARTQIVWGLDYIARAYGSPCAAWGHSQATNWY